ncbi:Putative deoxyribonuclease RhsC [Stieleria neptunia]|uniref:Deoxyribonuclease RhsC n=1 Tax=Stieleria neptunia TaxID=2527979 RepID=A0A518HX93_9BACT|nr:putative Ig domain-containing protein [Stieleria neptunia]QDV45478.1 Putative deoxyribonuclease RhsC [Stieleria neptunia]
MIFASTKWECTHPVYDQNPYHPYGQATEFAVVATEDHTEIQIDPPADVEGENSDPYTITLHRGQTYQLRRRMDNDDLTGTLIASNKPIAVFSGNECANVPTTFAACDHLVEQLPPTSTWGSSFLSIPFAGRDGGDTFRFLANEDDTSVTVNGTIVAALDQGEFYETIIDGPAEISSDKPILVGQYANGAAYHSTTQGDPFMVLLPPTQQYLTEIVVSTPTETFETNHVNIIAQSSAIAGVTIDDVAVDPLLFVSIGDSGFSGAQVPITVGEHVISSQTPISVTSYGIDFYDSYGYIGGQSLSSIGDIESITINPPTEVAGVDSTRHAVARVADALDNPMGGILVQFEVEGVNAAAGFAYTDENGFAVFHYKGISEGTDQISAVAGTETATASKSWIVAPPEIEISSPTIDFDAVSGDTVLITGMATAGLSTAPIAAVLVNGSAVDALDELGNFFYAAPIYGGKNPFDFTAIDIYGQEASTSVTIEGYSLDYVDSQIDSANSGDFGVRYATTSWSESEDRLFVDLSVQNLSSSEFETPLLLGFTNFSSNLVSLDNFDGITLDGIPYLDFSNHVTDETLSPNEWTQQRTAEFLVPKRNQFTYDLVLIGEPNSPPEFKSAPITATVAGSVYEYELRAEDPDGDDLTYRIAAGPDAMSLVPATGTSGPTLVWNSSVSDLGLHNVVLEVSDPEGAVGVQDYQLSVLTPIEGQAPFFLTNPVTSAVMDLAYRYDVAAKSLAGLPVTISFDPTMTVPGGMQLTPTGDGTAEITWTPNANDVASYPIVLLATDTAGNSTEQPYTLGVSSEPDNRPPLISSTAPATYVAGKTKHYQVRATDPDEGDILHYTIIGNGGFSGADEPAIDPATGLFSWTPPLGLTTDASFTIAVDDGLGLSDDEMFTLEPSGDSTASISGIVFRDLDGDGVKSVTEAGLPGIPVFIDVNGNQAPDADEVQVSSTVDGSYQFDTLPAGDHVVMVVPGQDDIASTSAGAWHTVTLAVGQTIASVDFAISARTSNNQKPEITSIAPDVAPRLGLYEYDVVANDPDGDSLTFELLQSPEEMTIDSETGAIRWTAPISAPDLVYVTIRVEDEHGGFDIQPYDIAINGKYNQPPVIESPPVTSAVVGQPYIYQVIAQDPNPEDTLTYLVNSPYMNEIIVDYETGLLEWTPTKAESVPISIWVRDDGMGADFQDYVINVSVNPDNTPPEIRSEISGRVAIGREYRHVLDVFDAEGDALTYGLTSTTTGLSVSPDGVISWTPAADQGGDHTFTVTVSDGHPNGTVDKTYTLTAINGSANTPPRIQSAHFIDAVVGEFYERHVIAIDDDGDTLAYVIDGQPGGMQIHPATGRAHWTPLASQVGTYTFDVMVVDALGASDLETVTMNVINVNRPPTVAPIREVTTPVLVPYRYAVSASDPDGHQLTFSLGPGTTADELGDLNIDPDTGVIDWLPLMEGRREIDLRVTDELGLEIRMQFDVESLPEDHGEELFNTPPEFTSTPPKRIKIEELWSYQVAADDDDGDTITYSMTTAPPGATFDPVTQIMEWTPSSAYIQQLVPFRFEASDGKQTAFQNVLMGVTEFGNLVPVIDPIGPQTIVIDSTMQFRAGASDGNGDVLYYSLDDDSIDLGIVVDHIGRIAWTPTIDHVDDSPYSVTLSVTDTIATSTETFTIDVITDDTPPTIALYTDRDQALIDQTIAVQIDAVDNQAIAETTLVIESLDDGTTVQQLNIPVPVDHLGRASIDTSVALTGVVTLLATTTDTSGNSVEARKDVTILNLQDDGYPTVQLTQPSGSLSTPTDVIGTVTDDTGLVDVLVELYPSNGSAAITLSHSTGDVNNLVPEIVADAVARIDTTNLANDSYTLVVSATDVANNTSTADVRIEVDSDLKLGNLTIAVTDLTVPFLSSPIPIIRSYDSLGNGNRGSDKWANDESLGPGWRLGLPGAGLEIFHADTSFSTFDDRIPLRYGDKAVFTHVDGTTESWTFQPEPANALSSSPPMSHVKWVPDPGTTSALLVPDTPIYYVQGEYLIFTRHGEASYQTFSRETEFVQVRTRNGTVYHLNPDSGEAISVEGTDGSVVTMSDDGFIAQNGASVLINRDPSGRIAEIVDPLGNSINYTYDARGRLESFTDRSGRVEHYEYHGDTEKLAGVFDENGNRLTEYEFDDEGGRLSVIIDAEGRRIETRTDEEAKTETIIDAFGNTTMHEYNWGGFPVRTVDALGGETIRDFRGDGVLLSEIDPLGRGTHYEYDAIGRKTSETDPLGNTSYWTYFADGSVRTHTNPLGQTTVTTMATRELGGVPYMPSLLGKQILETRTTIDPSGDAVTLEREYQQGYNGLQEFYLTAATGFETYTRSIRIEGEDEFGVSNFVTVNSTYEPIADPAFPLGRLLTQTTQNAFGETGREEVFGRTTVYQRDPESRVTNVSTFTGTTTTEYDVFGRVVATTDHLGRRSETEYDLAGNVLAELVPDFTPLDSTDNVRSSNVYDIAGRLYSDIDVYGRTTIYEYDELGRIEFTVLPDNTPADDTDNPRLESRYDAAGQLTASIDQYGRETTYTYDPAGRQIESASPSGVVRRTVYDAAGRQIATNVQQPGASIATGSMQYYDESGRTTRTEQYADLDINLSTDTNGFSTTAVNTASPVNLISWTESVYVNGLQTEFVSSSGDQTDYDYNDRGQLVGQTDSSGLGSVITYNFAGNQIQTITNTVDEFGDDVQLVQQTVYDDFGREIYSSDSAPISTPVAEITGTATVYDSYGRVESTSRLIGLDIDIDAVDGFEASSLVDAGSVISTSTFTFDDLGRSSETVDSFGQRSQTVYDQYGNAVESRTEYLPSGASEAVWQVIRTIYDSEGRVEYQTDAFLLPIGTALGDNGASTPSAPATKYVYDDFGRQIAVERHRSVELQPSAGLSGDVHPGFVVTDPGELLSASETLYDSQGRVARTITGRVPTTALSADELAVLTLPAEFDLHLGNPDSYAAIGLTPGTIRDTLYDSAGRLSASLEHPLAAAVVGLDARFGTDTLVRLRTESQYDELGRLQLQRSGLVQVITDTGTLTAVEDDQSVDRVSHRDVQGNLVRTDYVTGGTIHYDSLTDTTSRSSGTVDSFVTSRFDDQNRLVAEMQQTSGATTATWSDVEESYVDGSGNLIPTKLYRYNDRDQLTSVELPAVPDPLSADQLVRPKYQYAYDELGQQATIIDPLLRETRFTYDSGGQQVSRTLPIGFGTDGAIADQIELDSWIQDLGSGSAAFTETMTYDDHGRQATHVSFEGVVTENVYEPATGRLSERRYFESVAAYDNGIGTADETWRYGYDGLGHRTQATKLDSAGNVLRSETTAYDDLGRVFAEVSEEGVLHYRYDPLGRMTATEIHPVGTAVSALPGATPERSTAYTYDALGRLDTVTESANSVEQHETDYAYDLQGRVADHSVVDASTGNLITTDYDYDALGRLDTQTDTDQSGNTLAEYDYDVRADGKRTKLTERFAVDHDNDPQTALVLSDPTTYDWTYDDVGRLTDEVIDHWDDTLDQTESFTYDLTGNRVSLERDHGNDGVDQAITYNFDANDRLIDEVLDDLVDDNNDTTTTYTYDHTQNTSKTVASTSTLVTRSSQLFSYNLQGRMNAVVNEGYDAAGVLNSRERASYEYDSKSYRVSLTSENGTTLSADLAAEVWSLTSEASFLADHHNHADYTQTIRETTYDDQGAVVKQVDFTFGSDEIAQTVTEGGTTETHVFGHDGHGSVRVLYALAGTAESIAQVFTFAAYGEMLAVHGADGVSVPVLQRLSSLGYSGEHFDAKAQQQYLRARFYDPVSGRFNRLDPFSGWLEDPQSLHKYAYVHGDPIQGLDPTGEFFAAAIGSVVSTLGNLIRNNKTAAVGVVAIDRTATLADAVTAASLLAIGSSVPFPLLAGLLVSLIPGAGIAKILGKSFDVLGTTGRLVIGSGGDLATVLAQGGKGRLDDAGELLSTYIQKLDDYVPDEKLVQLGGELGTVKTAQKLGLEPLDDFIVRYRGIDGLYKNGDKFVIAEAKGFSKGSSPTLGITKHGEQLSQQWIQRQATKLINKGGEFRKWGLELQDAIDERRVQVLLTKTPVDKGAKTVGETTFELRNYSQLGAISYNP